MELSDLHDPPELLFDLVEFLVFCEVGISSSENKICVIEGLILSFVIIPKGS